MIFAIFYFVLAVWNAVLSMIDYNRHKRTWFIPAVIAVFCLVMGVVVAILSVK